MDDHVQGSYEMEMEEILNIVEALHAIEQLGIDAASSIPPATEILARLTTIEHPIVTNATTFEKDEDLKEQRTRACHRHPAVFLWLIVIRKRSFFYLFRFQHC